MITNSVEFFRNNRYSIPKNIDRPIIVADKLRTPENYGNILRLADTIACSKVIFINPKEELAHRKIRKTARDSYHNVAFEFVEEENFKNLIPENYSLYALETAVDSENIFQSKLPDRIALVVGNEKAGINSSILKQCEQIVHIPLTGNCTSLNVSHATAIAIFEWLRQKIFSV